MKIFKMTILLFVLFLFSTFTKAQTTHIVQVSNYVFTPSDLTIAKGDTVKWVWVEGVHTTTSDSTSGVNVWNAPIDQLNTSYSRVFNSPGVAPYYCIYYKSLGMVGTITITSTTGISDKKIDIKNYYLKQNYPNPFNPITIIKYSIPQTQKVTLKVYDILGNEIKTLVNETKEPGNYKVKLNGNNLSSGVYFYRIHAGDFVQTKKLVLLK